MSADQAYLVWLHDRLVNVHKEPPNADFMHKLRCIIIATPQARETPNTLVNYGEFEQTLRKSNILAVMSPTRIREKIRQAYELAGCARRDNDRTDETRWLTEAKRLEQLLQEVKS